MPIKERNIKLIAVLSWVAVLLWMLGIFIMSAQVADQSNKLSVGITEAFIGKAENALPESDLNIDWINFLVRKNAHFLIYLVLAVLVMNALNRTGINGKRALILSLGICVLYAASDEVHQLFVPGRGCKVTDVLIDSTGALTGLGIYWLYNKLKVHRNLR